MGYRSYSITVGGSDRGGVTGRPAGAKLGTFFPSLAAGRAEA